MKLIIKLSILLLLFSFAAQFTFAKGKEGDKNSLNKTVGTPNVTKFNINNISTLIYSNGKADVSGSNPGYTYPILSGKTANFVSGLMWGGYVGAPDVAANLKVGGSLYRQGLTVGRIIGTGPGAVADNPSNPDVRIYRVRRDYRTGSLATESLDEGKSVADVYNQYEKDWNEWPVNWGAPFEDIGKLGSDGKPVKDAQDNNIKDGVYDPLIDIPGIPGADQTLWFVANDLDKTVSSQFYGTTPMGVEQQCTIWGYKQAGALGNMFFKKYVIINKNFEKKDFTKMYVSYVSDTDIGGGSYDYSGCDTTLSLFYTYSAIPDNKQYGVTPPATGYDFFQGPKVRGAATDTAIFNGKYLPGWKNLPMSAHFIFINGDATWGDPDQASAKGTGELYNLFQGKVATTSMPFEDYVTKKTTKFALAGDPFTRTGWVDGLLHLAGDRRNGGVAGPFTLAYGDTQEVVIAEMSAGATAGIDNMGALKLLYEYDKTAQIAYNRLFKLPQPAPQPKFTVKGFDKRIVLNWGEDSVAVNKTEGYDVFGYKFQGYNIYQLPSNSASISEGILLATYDIADGITAIIDKTTDSKSGAIIDFVAANGGDTGIRRSMVITTDALSGAPELYNGNRYYFAVSSYSYNPDPPFGAKVLNNPLEIITVTPASTDLGVTYSAKAGDNITVGRTGGISDGIVTVKVIDPSQSLGHNYKINFEEDTHGEMVWKLTDVTKNVVRLSNEPQNIMDASRIIDGIQVQVSGPALGVNSFAFTPSTDRWLDYYDGPYLGIDFLGSSVTPDQYVKVEVRFLSTPTGQKAYRYLRGGTPNYGYQDYQPQYFTVWDVTHSPARQLSVAYVTQKGQPGETLPWQPTSAPGTSRDYLFILPNPYTETPNADLMAGKPNSGVYPAMYALWPQIRDGRTFSPQAGQVFSITPFFVNTTADVFTFTSPSVSYDLELAKTDVEKINVFPNPYYGVNRQELTKYVRWVTFSHLPAKATMRIFNLAGQLVRTIVKDDASSQFQRWDLLNNNQLPVGSGLYIVHIDMPDLGKTKILKVAIIQEKQILDIF